MTSIEYPPDKLKWAESMAESINSLDDKQLLLAIGVAAVNVKDEGDQLNLFVLVKAAHHRGLGTTKEGERYEDC